MKKDKIQDLEERIQTLKEEQDRAVDADSWDIYGKKGDEIERLQSELDELRSEKELSPDGETGEQFLEIEQVPPEEVRENTDYYEVVYGIKPGKYDNHTLYTWSAQTGEVVTQIIDPQNLKPINNLSTVTFARGVHSEEEAKEIIEQNLDTGAFYDAVILNRNAPVVKSEGGKLKVYNAQVDAEEQDSLEGYLIRNAVDAEVTDVSDKEDDTEGENSSAEAGEESVSSEPDDDSIEVKADEAEVSSNDYVSSIEKNQLYDNVERSWAALNQGGDMDEVLKAMSELNQHITRNTENLSANGGDPIVQVIVEKGNDLGGIASEYNANNDQDVRRQLLDQYNQRLRERYTVYKQLELN